MVQRLVAIVSIRAWCSRTVVATLLMGLLLAACGGMPAPSAAHAVLRFDSPTWTGGQQVALPQPQHGRGLELTSSGAVASTANYIGLVSLDASNFTTSVLVLDMYVSNILDLNTNVWGSRVALMSDFSGKNGYFMWFDAANKSGWNTLTVPLSDLGTAGKPDPSRILEVQVTLYSTKGTQAQVIFESLTQKTL